MKDATVNKKVTGDEQKRASVHNSVSESLAGAQTGHPSPLSELLKHRLALLEIYRGMCVSNKLYGTTDLMNKVDVIDSHINNLLKRYTK